MKEQGLCLHEIFSNVFIIVTVPLLASVSLLVKMIDLNICSGFPYLFLSVYHLAKILLKWNIDHLLEETNSLKPD